jgi:spore maturation protein CgeB
VPTDQVFIFTYRASQVREFREAGFRHVEYLPLAANPKRRRPLRLVGEEVGRYRAEISFVGSSMAGPAERQRSTFMELFRLSGGGDPAFEEDVARRLDEVLKEQRKDFRTFRIPELFGRHFQEILQAWPAGRTSEDPVKLVGEMAAAEKRLKYIGALGPQGIRVWGDPGWRSLARQGVKYAGEAGHLVELTKIYSATLVNIDVGRLYQPDIVPMRVFDILACGGFLLAEHSEALADLFEPGKEVESYRTLEELCDKAAFYRAHPDSAREIARRGMEKVSSMHTIQARVKHMLYRDR